MSADIGITLSADAAGLQQGLNQATRYVSGFADSSEAKLKSLTSIYEAAAAKLATAGKSASEAFRIRADLSGIDPSLIAKEVAHLKLLEDQLKNTQNGLGAMGMSAKATSAALRGVPAQMTDIVTSLQGGQQPLTVLLQQGGQLKDMFGGVVPAVRALGGYILGLVNPMTVAAAAVGALGYAYYKGSQEMDAYNRAIILSGDVSGVTAANLQLMARRMSELGGTQGKAADTLAQFAASGAAGAEQLERFSSAAIKFEKFTGTAVESTVKQFAELKKSPLEATLKLNEGMNYLTESLYKQLKALDEQGKHTEAANLAQSAFADTLNSRAKEMEAQLGLIERGWLAVKSAVFGVGDAMLSIGRSDGLDVQVKKQRELVALLEKTYVPREKRMSHGMYVGSVSDAEMAGARNRLAVLEESARIEARRAQGLAEQGRLVAARAAFDKDGLEFLTNAEKREKEITQARNEGVAARASQAEIEKRIANIREKYKDPDDKNLNSMQAALKAAHESLAVSEEQAGTNEKLTESEKKYVALLNDSTKGYSKAALAVRELALLELQRAGVQEKTNAQAAADAAASQKYTSAVQGNIDKLREEAEVTNLSALEVQKIAGARQIDKAVSDALYGTRKNALGVEVQFLKVSLEQSLAIIEKAKAHKQETNAVLEEIAAKKLSIQYEQEIAQLRIDNTVYLDPSERAAAMLEKEAAKRREAIAALKEDSEERRRVIQQYEDWYKLSQDKIGVDKFRAVWESVDRTAHDTFVNIFQGGQDAFTKLGNTLKATVLDLLYQMTVRKWVFAITAQVTGNAALAGNGGSGAGGLGSAANAIGSLGNLASLFSSDGFSSVVTSGVASLAKMAGAAGFDSLSQVLGKYAGTIGDYAQVLGEGLGYLSAVQSATEGKWGQAIGAAAGTWFFGPLGGAVGGAIGSFVDGLVDGHGYVSSMGDSQRTYGSDGKLISNGNNGQSWWNNTAAANAVADSLQARYAKTATALGINAVQTTFTYGSNNSDGGKFAIGGFAGDKSFFSGETKTTDDAMKLAASRAVFTALEGSDLPKFLKGAFDGMVASSMSQEQIDAALNGAQALKALHDNFLAMPFDNLKDMSYAATQALIEFSGSIDKLGQNLGTYYDNFYTAEEKRQQTATNIVGVLNKAGGTFSASDLASGGSLDTRAEFRALVEATDPSSPLYAALLSVAGAFAGIVPAAQEATAATQDTAAELAKLAETNQKWQDKLDILTGKRTEREVAMANDLAGATDATTQALIRQVYAQEDLKAAADKFAASMSGLGDNQFDLENQLLHLQGQDSVVRDRVRSQALAKLIEGIIDPEQIARITAQFDYNEGLKDQISALEAASKAQDAANQAAMDAARGAEQLRQAWQSVTNSLFDEVDRIRGVIGANSPQGYAQAQAQFAIATAQARAGDQDAAKLLPSLSKALLTLAEANATSLIELRRIQGQTAASLELTGNTLAGSFGLQVPHLATGTNYVPHDMLVVAHKGEAVVPAQYNPAAMGGWAQEVNDALLAEIQALRAQVSALLEKADEGNDSAKTTATVLKRVTRGGDNVITKDYTLA